MASWMFRNRNWQWLWLLLKLPHWMVTYPKGRSTNMSGGWNRPSEELRTMIIPWSLPTKLIQRGTDVKMNTEDSLWAEENGSPHLQDGCEHREGSRPSFLSGNVTDYMCSLSSIYACSSGVKNTSFSLNRIIREHATAQSLRQTHIWKQAHECLKSNSTSLSHNEKV